ncbi:MAG: PAS domain S-box protein [Salinibacter sp.]
MSGARDPLFRTLAGPLGVGTKLLGAFLIFFLCAVAPAAGTWFFLHQQLPTEQSAPAENRGRQFSERGPALAGAPGLVRQETERTETAPDPQPHAATRQQVETLARIWGGAVLMLIGLGGAFLYLLWKHVVVPLKRLKREAIAVAGGARGNHLTVPDEEDEIGMLARALRHLKAQVDASDEAGHTATQGASAAPSTPASGRSDDARRVEASDPVSVTYGRSGEGPEGESDAATDWTVSTEDVRPLSARAERERDGETHERPPPPVGDGTAESETGVRYDEFMAVIHPEDRDRLRRRQDQAMQNGVPIDIEYRIVSPNGDEQALRERGVVKMGKDGSPTQFSGHVLDVTEEKANEQKIERLQNDYNHLLSSLPDALVVVEAHSSTIVEANEAAASLFEASVDELLGRQKTSLYPAGTKDQFAALFEAARHSGSSVPNAVRRFPDGTPIHIVTDAGNEVPVSLAVTSVERSGQTFFVAVLSDITEERTTRRRLRTFEAAAEQSDDMIVVTDASGNVQYANPAAASITGYEQDTLTGNPLRFTQLDGGDAEEETQMWDALNQGESFRKTIIDERKDGSTVEIDQTIAPVHDATGAVSHYVLTGRDITERVEREEELHRRTEALRERGARLRGLTNSIPGVVYQFYKRPDDTRGLHFVSGHAGPMLGIAPDADIFLDMLIERVPASHRDELTASLDAALEQQQSWSFEFPYEHPSGKRMWLLGSATPDPKDDELLLNGLLLDITERKKAERASAEERDRFVTLFESLPTPVLHCELTPKGTLVADVNKAFEDVFGVDAKAAEGKDVNDLIVPNHKEAEAEQIERRVISGNTEHFEVRRQTTNGVRDFRLQATGRTSESDATELYAIYTDITERKEREERLRGRRQKIESLYTVAGRLLATEHPESVFRRVHTVLRDVLDYPFTATGVVKEDRIVFDNTAAKDELLVPTPPPAPITSGRVSARALREEETVVSDRDGAPDWAPREGPLDAVAGLPMGEHGVITVGQTDGTAFTSFDLRLMGLLGTYAAVVLDRLEREQELRAAKEEAEDASEFKSAMLANISHEIRTPLTAINGFSEVLVEELEPPHESLAERVHEGGKRLLDTFDSVLQLSQLEAGTQEIDPGRCALDRIVRGALDEWREQATEQSISLNVDVPNSPVKGLWDAELVGEIVGNLLDNAIKFTPSGGEVSVRVRNNDGHAVLEVEDTGIGIGEQFRNDMFRAFKQESEGLRREFEGVGLGLAVTKKAVNRMGGCIEVDSEKGEGSRFIVRLPKEW